MASTAELTSDGDLTSSNRSVTPSPPLPPSRFDNLLPSKNQSSASKVLIAPITKDDKPDVADVGEAAVEKTLGRKRCIMFACGGKSPQKTESSILPAQEAKQAPAPTKR
ncbi:MAG: hypothetical protein M1823_007444, partial [Watsoniomyces obsoletus]